MWLYRIYKTPEKYLRALVESLQAQTYGKWELCLSDGSGADSPIRELLKQLQKEGEQNQSHRSSGKVTDIRKYECCDRGGNG